MEMAACKKKKMLRQSQNNRSFPYLGQELFSSESSLRDELIIPLTFEEMEHCNFGVSVVIYQVGVLDFLRPNQNKDEFQKFRFIDRIDQRAQE